MSEHTKEFWILVGTIAVLDAIDTWCLFRKMVYHQATGRNIAWWALNIVLLLALVLI
ncbi:MAG TPA: hypothetical protein VJO33_12005 [Gemmatimonadaceae bacterium]|nr:hypothetical protein [Gemmatimonadaceae bacterium]